MATISTIRKALDIAMRPGTNNCRASNTPIVVVP